MQLPDIFEQFEYWADNPPSHILLRLMSGYRSKRGLTDVEKQVVAQSGPALPQSSLPNFVRQWLQEEEKKKKGVKGGK